MERACCNYGGIVMGLDLTTEKKSRETLSEEKKIEANPLVGIAIHLDALSNLKLPTIIAHSDPNLIRKKINCIRAASLLVQAGNLITFAISVPCAVIVFSEKGYLLGSFFTGLAIFGACGIPVTRRLASNVEKGISPRSKDTLCEKLLYRC
jgi:hypothetical protein